MKQHTEKQNRRHNLEKGQSLVEMSLGFVVLLIVLSGLVDLGRAYFTLIALEDAAGEGAIYLSINPACLRASDGPACADPNNAEYRVMNAVNGEIDWENVTITMERPTPYGVGETVRVEVEYPFQIITPVISQIARSNNISLSSDATQTIISETVATAP